MYNTMYNTINIMFLKSPFGMEDFKNVMDTGGGRLRENIIQYNYLGIINNIQLASVSNLQ